MGHFTIQDMSYDYQRTTNTGKKKKKCTKKIVRKNLPENDVPDSLTSSCSLKTLRSFSPFFVQMTRRSAFIVTLRKEYQNLQKWANMQKSLTFYENWLYQKQKPLETYNCY